MQRAWFCISLPAWSASSTCLSDDRSAFQAAACEHRPNTGLKMQKQCSPTLCNIWPLHSMSLSYPDCILST